MSESVDFVAQLRSISGRAEFNNWLGVEVAAASVGEVELRLPWRKELGQYSGFLHAGVIGALLDTACGFAAYTMVGPSLASQYSVKCLRPAVAQVFVVKARVLKPGKQQVFTQAELTSLDEPGKLLAVGDTLLVPAGM
ncbi:MAG: PaaI family thioesterase [Afipia sp.]|jgi:uncharacterized protein (TIGR00369 family)|nr:MAG: PaaI family thioesterase [Afipia sp.]